MNSSLRRVRDSQRIRVYRANSGVLGTPLPHMNDVLDFSNTVVSSNIWKTMFPSPKVWRVPHLKPGKGARTAHVLWHHDGRIEIAFPKAYRFSTYVLHELAHFGLGIDGEIAAHGPEFVGAWLTLVREFCSPRTSHALEKGLAREKVKMHIPIIDLSDSKYIAPVKPKIRYDENTNTVYVPDLNMQIDQLELFG